MAVENLPRSLTSQIRGEVGHRPLTTRDLLSMAAKAGDASTSNWDLNLNDDPGPEAWDGPLLEPGSNRIVATKFAAEACALGIKIAEALDLRLNIRILGAAAASVFFSSAHVWAGRVFMSAGAADSLGVSLMQFTQIVTAFTRDPAGRDLGRRLETASMLNPDLTRGFRAAVNEAINDELPRSYLGTLSYWQVIRIQVRVLFRGLSVHPNGISK